jgi:hypothetical protein
MLATADGAAMNNFKHALRGRQVHFILPDIDLLSPHGGLA